MIPGITASFPFVEPVDPGAGVAVELVHTSNPDGNSTSFNIDPGPEFPERTFIINWTYGRNVTTGTPGTTTLTIGGKSVTHFQTSGGFWPNYTSVNVPEGTDPMAVSISNSGGDIHAVNIWLIGTPSAPGRIVNLSSSILTTADPLTAELDNDRYEAGSKVIVNAAYNIASELSDLIDESWVDEVQNVTGNYRGTTGRTQVGIGDMPSDATEVTHVASPSSTSKAIWAWQVAPKSVEQLLYEARQDIRAYHFAADRGAFSDVDGLVPCVDTDPVAFWKNNGSYAEDAIQTTLARRPIFRTGGANGKPYLECDRTEQHWFADLTGIPQPSGISSFTHFNMMAVVDLDDLSALQPILGSTTTNGKNGFWITTAGSIRIFKNQFLSPANVVANAPVAVRGSPSSGTSSNHNIDEVRTTTGNSTNSSSTIQSTSQFLRSTSHPAYFHGKIYECLFFHGASLSQPHTDMFMSALCRKYGIS